MKKVNLRPAETKDFDFIWKLYSDSISSLIKSKIKGEWIDSEQRKQFEEIYSESTTKIITTDGKDVGWIDFRHSAENNIQLVNGYIAEDQRRRGVMSAVLKEIISPSVTVEASTIKDNPFLTKWGFQTTSMDDHFETKQLKN